VSTATMREKGSPDHTLLNKRSNAPKIFDILSSTLTPLMASTFAYKYEEILPCSLLFKANTEASVVRNSRTIEGDDILAISQKMNRAVCPRDLDWNVVCRGLLEQCTVFTTRPSSARLYAWHFIMGMSRDDRDMRAAIDNVFALASADRRMLQDVRLFVRSDLMLKYVIGTMIRTTISYIVTSTSGIKKLVVECDDGVFGSPMTIDVTESMLSQSGAVIKTFMSSRALADHAFRELRAWVETPSSDVWKIRMRGDKDRLVVPAPPGTQVPNDARALDFMLRLRVFL
jgi:hypothetical protein